MLIGLEIFGRPMSVPKLKVLYPNTKGARVLGERVFSVILERLGVKGEIKICRVKERWFRPQNNPSNSPFKTCKIMNKTIRKILQVISYFIAALLGAAGGSELM